MQSQSLKAPIHIASPKPLPKDSYSLPGLDFNAGLIYACAVSLRYELGNMREKPVVKSNECLLLFSNPSLLLYVILSWCSPHEDLGEQPIPLKQ